MVPLCTGTQRNTLRRLVWNQQVSRYVPWSYSYSRSSSSNSRSTPRFQVSAHTALFTVLLVPVAGFTLYAGRYGPKDEELEDKIRERYQPDVRAAHSKNQAMADFFLKAIKNPDTGAEDSRLEQVLHGGKGEKKRFHAVDKELYGTTAGVEEKQRTEEAIKQAAEERKQRKKRRRKKDAVVAVTDDKGQQDASELEASTTSPAFQLPAGTAQVATVVVVGTVAAAIGFLVGGQRKQ